MSARQRDRLDDELFRTGGTVRVRPVVCGDRVRAYGDVGTVTAIDWSIATHTRIVTVQVTPRIRMRVAERDVELIEARA